MTWVIGGSTIFGYGVMISDVCVSWGKGGYAQDCLQKVYPLGNYIFGGFAGSVKLGFIMLQDLRNFLKLPEEETKDTGWHPDWVAENWYPRAREIFAKASKEEQALHSSVILVGASPNEDIGIPGFARIYVATLDDPAFEPQVIKGGNNILSIGSGAGVEKYKEEIRKLSDTSDISLMQGEVGMPGGYGTMLLHCISGVIRKNPEKGISKHLHIALIRRGQFSLSNNDTTIYYPKGEKIEIKMPPVAKSYSEFEELIRRIKQSTKGAIAK